MAMNIMNSTVKLLKKNIFIAHLMCWLLFIFYELALVYFAIGKLEQPYMYIVFYSINIAFFYVYVALLNFTFTGPVIRYLPGVAGYLVLLVFYLLTKTLVDFILDSPPPAINNPFSFVQLFFPRNFMRAFYFTLLGTFYWSANHISYFRRHSIESEKQQLLAEKEKAELENQLARSRNAYLQQQLNPHMLFNTLNFVYSSVQKYSEEGAQCIWLLTEIMRFSLEEAGPDGKISLDREAEQIKNLLAINCYRYAEPLCIHMDLAGDFSRFSIIPLILLTLTENVFKHGNLTDAGCPAVLRLFTDESGNLTYFSRNLKKPKSDHRRRREPLGLQNVRIRLNASYAGNYQLNIEEPGDCYELTLKLKLCA